MADPRRRTTPWRLPGLDPRPLHRGRQKAYANATAPAINVRGLTYDAARTIFRAARANDAKIVLFELARSEMSYTEQRPSEYASAVLAAAIKEGHRGPVFIQGDHYQINAKKYAADPESELRGLRELAVEAIAAGYYNIDIDASTIVDLSLPTVVEQQTLNARHTAEMTRVIREAQPEGITVSIGGEIGEVGGHNSTVEDLHGFMEGYVAELGRQAEAVGRELPGISKISVQTGTSHGGVPLPDGTIKEVAVDFDTLAELSREARERYGMGGTVQHGASTLPEEAFDRFAQANAIEVHLATAFQNQIYDNAAFPADLKADLYAYLTAHHLDDERKPDQTDAQFYYTTRKRGFGPFQATALGPARRNAKRHHGGPGTDLRPDHAPPRRCRQRRSGRPHHHAGRGASPPLEAFQVVGAATWHDTSGGVASSPPTPGSRCRARRSLSPPVTSSASRSAATVRW